MKNSTKVWLGYVIICLVAVIATLGLLATV
jgi:hypothetical protein